MDFGAIGAVVSSLNALKDLSRAAANIRDQAMMQEKIIEFHATIMDAQQAVFAAQEERIELLDKIQALQRQVSEFEVWENISCRYELISVGHGATVYHLKPENHADEPDHWLCPNCFARRKKSYLQNTGIAGQGRKLRHLCSICETVVSVDL